MSLRGWQPGTEGAGWKNVPAATQDMTFTPPGRTLPPALISGRRETDPKPQTHHHPWDKVDALFLGPSLYSKVSIQEKNKMNVETVPSFDGSWKHCPSCSPQAALGPLHTNDVAPRTRQIMFLREEVSHAQGSREISKRPRGDCFGSEAQACEQL